MWELCTFRSLLLDKLCMPQPGGHVTAGSLTIEHVEVFLRCGWAVSASGCSLHESLTGVTFQARRAPLTGDSAVCQ